MFIAAFPYRYEPISQQNRNKIGMASLILAICNKELLFLRYLVLEN